MNILNKLSEARQNVREDKRRDFLAGKNAAEALCRGLNGGSQETLMFGFLEGLVHEHRFLQNEAIWTIVRALSHLGSEDLANRVDARNESAIKACQQIRVLLADRTGV